MKTVMISLNSIDKVKSFVNDISRFDYDFDLVSGRYVIDAKFISSEPRSAGTYERSDLNQSPEALRFRGFSFPRILLRSAALRLSP